MATNQLVLDLIVAQGLDASDELVNKTETFLANRGVIHVEGDTNIDNVVVADDTGDIEQ